MKMSTILVPTDFSDDASEALSVAKEFARHFGARIVVLHAYHVDLPAVPLMAGAYALPQSFHEEQRSSATAQVDEIAEKLRSGGFDASGIVLSEPASVAIVAQAESLPADLIVMGTRGRTGLEHLMLGSVAQRVVRTAPCPVLTVKAAE